MCSVMATTCRIVARRARAAVAIMGVLLALTACAQPPAAQAPVGDAAASQPRSGRTKTIVFGITILTPIARTSVTSAAGGWVTANEIHTNGLITSDVYSRRPIGRLAENAPTLDDGTMFLLPDGRMRVTYKLRHDVTWQDGIPFNAQDLLFSQRFWNDPGLPPVGTRTALNFIESSEAPDDYTFVLYFKQPYYLAGVLSPRLFW